MDRHDFHVCALVGQQELQASIWEYEVFRESTERHLIFIRANSKYRHGLADLADSECFVGESSLAKLVRWIDGRLK